MPSGNKNPHPCFRLSYYRSSIQTMPCNCLFLWCHTHALGATDISINYLSYSHSGIFICCTRFLKNIYLYSCELSSYIQTINQNVDPTQVDFSADIVLLLHLGQQEEFYQRGRTKLLSGCYSGVVSSSGTVT